MQIITPWEGDLPLESTIVKCGAMACNKGVVVIFNRYKAQVDN